MKKTRVKGEFSVCCQTSVTRSPKLAGYEPYCDCCHKKCELTAYKAEILVDGRVGKIYDVVGIIHHRKIINVLIDDEGEPFEISYLRKELKLYPVNLTDNN